MCDVRLRGSVDLEVFPSIDCDELSQMEIHGVEEGQILAIEGIWVAYGGVTFVFLDGRSSSLPLRAIEVVRDCGWCDLSQRRNAIQGGLGLANVLGKVVGAPELRIDWPVESQIHARPGDTKELLLLELRSKPDYDGGPGLDERSAARRLQGFPHQRLSP